MKKLLFLIALSMLFVSCSKDDSDNTSQEPDKREQLIIGKWLVTDYWWTYNGLGYADAPHWKAVSGNITLSINNGGTCSVTGEGAESISTGFDTSFELGVDFPKITNWEWKKGNPTPLRLYNNSGTDYPFGVTFITNDILELKNGNIGYKFKRQ